MDTVGLIMEYEQGELSDGNTLKLFSELARSKMVFSLQGHYQRTFNALVEDNFMDVAGKLKDKAKEVIDNE